MANDRLVVKKSTLSGTLSIPSSKSHTLRALIFGCLAKGFTEIKNYLPSPDTTLMIEALKHFGAKINVNDEMIRIEGVNGKITHTEDVICCGNSGIALRFLTALGALGNHPVVVTGDYSIRHNRCMRDLVTGLRQLEVEVQTMRGDNFAPIIVKGPIKKGTITLSGEDSQPVSALLIAGSFANHEIEIEVKNPGEKPWISMTLDWLNRFKIPYEKKDFHYYKVFGNATLEGFNYTVPADLSTLAFPVVAALITQSEISINNVDMSDCQGDKELIYILQKMGAHIEIKDKKLSLKPSFLVGTDVDVNDFIDALPILAVLACFAKGKTKIYNAQIARKKECDRIHAICTELRKMGANIEEFDDGLTVYESNLKGAVLNSYQDHRMAMALAVAALSADGESKILDSECIKKTYPNFIEQFKGLGALLNE